MQSCVLNLCRQLDDITFHKLSDNTLNELADFFEDLGDSGLCCSDFDVALAVSVTQQSMSHVYGSLGDALGHGIPHGTVKLVTSNSGT